MNTKIALLIALLLLVVAEEAHSQARLLGYVNGVCTTREAAMSSATSLMEAYVDYIDEATETSYDLSDFERVYHVELFHNHVGNPDIPECFGYGLLESALQSGRIDSVEEFWKTVESRYEGTVLETSTEYVGERIESIRATAEKMVNESLPIIVGDLEFWAAQRQVVLVMHSQGNFFGNDSWGALSSDQKRSVVGLVGVATPDSGVRGDGNYFTHQCDPISLVPGAAEPNLVTEECDDLACAMACHFFGSYLAGTFTGGLSRDALILEIDSTFASLDTPELPEVEVTSLEIAQEESPGLYSDVGIIDCDSDNYVDGLKLGRQTRLRIFGSGLRNVPVAAFIEECEGMSVEPPDENADVVWREAFCTPEYTPGSKYGVIKDSPRGKELCEFGVEVTE